MSHQHCHTSGHCHEEDECCSHHHHHHHDDGCCSSHESCGDSDEDFAHDLLEVADAAWMELLKFKIKEHIEATSGAHLNKLAKLVSEANSERWKFKLAGKKLSSDYREKLCEYFSKNKS